MQKRTLGILAVTLGLFGAGACGEKRAAHRSKKKASDKEIVWALGSKLSYAALGNASNKVDRKVVKRMMGLSRTLALLLGTTVPPLPQRQKTSVKREADAMHYVVSTAGKKIGSHILRKYGAQHAALFELAMKSNLLLLVYQPRAKSNGLSDTMRKVIEKRAIAAKLPRQIYRPLCELMKAGASFRKVIAELHVFSKKVRAHLRKS